MYGPILFVAIVALVTGLYVLVRKGSHHLDRTLRQFEDERHWIIRGELDQMIYDAIAYQTRQEQLQARSEWEAQQ